MTGSGGYYWLREIAQGGMGRVDLLVRSEGTFRRLCAVKRLHGVLRDEPDCRAMFLDEARIAGLLEHPNVVRVFDVGEDAEGPYLMMDFVDGTTVRDMLRHALGRGSELPVAVVVQVVLQAALGLHAAHELRAPDGELLELVHRDVSPHNIMVGHDGIVRVMDFGIARSLGRTSRTSTGVLKGKFGYMSPEQLQFRSPDRRSDLFALGVVLYEMLTLTRLYGNEDGEGPRRILDEPPPDVGLERDLPPPLVELVFQLLAKDPDKRPGTATDVAARLREVLADLMLEDEEAIELAQYMAVELVEQASAQRAELQAALERLDRGELPRWPVAALERSPVVAVGSEDMTGTALAAPTRPRWLLGAAVVAVVAVALGAGVYIGRAPDEGQPASVGAEPEPPSATPPTPDVATPVTLGVAQAASTDADDTVVDDTDIHDVHEGAEGPPVAEAPAPGKRRARRSRRRPSAAHEPDTAAPAAPTTMRDPLAPAAFGSIGGDSP